MMQPLNILDLEKTLETTDDKIQILRDDIADTKKMVRKLYFESFPNLDAKVNNIIIKINNINDKLDESNALLIKLLNKSL